MASGSLGLRVDKKDIYAVGLVVGGLILLGWALMPKPTPTQPAAATRGMYNGNNYGFILPSSAYGVNYLGENNKSVTISQ